MTNCNISKNKAQHQYVLNLGICNGEISLAYNVNPENNETAIPARINILYKGQTYTTGFVGDSLFDHELLARGLPVVSSSASSGHLTFNKENFGEESALLVIDTPLINSSVSAQLLCPTCDGSDSGSDFSALCAQCREGIDCDIEASTDFLRTPGFKDGEESTRINLQFGETIVPTAFGGLPIDTVNLGESDTIVKRLNSVKCPIQESLLVPETTTIPDDTTTTIQIADLSLKSIDPVDIPGFGLADMYVGLDRSVPFITGPNGEYLSGSGGSMSIAYDETYLGGIWSSNFNVHVVFVAVPQGSIPASREPELVETNPGQYIFVGGEPDLVRNLISENCPCIQNLIDNPPETPLDPDSTEGHPCEGVDPACIPFFKEEFKAQNEPWTKTPSSELPGQNHYLVTENNEKVSEYGTNDCNFFIEGQAVHDAGEGITHGVDGSRETTTIGISGSGSAGVLSHSFTYKYDNVNGKWVKIPKK
jgi:hypothetical protein